VLLLHAWVESSACFDRLLQAVPPTLRIFAMDQRGHGDADKPADGYALVNFADDIEAFMDAVGLRSAVLLGSSSGGYVAQQVAVQVPDRVDGLVRVLLLAGCAPTTASESPDSTVTLSVGPSSSASRPAVILGLDMPCGRGVEVMAPTHGLLDMTVYGRQETWEDSPDGWAHSRIEAAAPMS